MDRQDAVRSEATLTALFFGLTLLLTFSAAYLCINDSLFRVMISLARQSELLASRYYGEIAPEHIFADAWRGMQDVIPFEVELSGERETAASLPGRRDWGLTLSPLDSAVEIMAISNTSPFQGFLQPADKITGIDSLREDMFLNLVQYLNSLREGETRIFFEREGHRDSVTVRIAASEPSSRQIVEQVDSIGYFAPALPSLEGREQELSELGAKAVGAFIIDLRGSRGENNEQAEHIAEKLSEIIASRPTVVLIDGTTKGASELIARKLGAEKSVSTMGSATAGSPSVVDEIPLRSGRKLYVSLNEAVFHDFREFEDSSKSDTISRKSDTAIDPEQPCGERGMTPLLFDLIHGGYLLDFATSSKFSGIPSEDDEDSLFTAFKAFLDKRHFRYDPLAEALSDLGINEMAPEMGPVYLHMRLTQRELAAPDLDEYREEIVRSLILTFFRVKTGGAPSLKLRARTTDPCLDEALTQIRGRISR